MGIKHQDKNSNKTAIIYNKITQRLTSLVYKTKKIYNRTIMKLDNIFTKCTTFISNQLNKVLCTIKKIFNYCIHSKEFKIILARMLITITMYAIYYLIIGGYNGS
jgi:hypothetical protein